MRIGLTYTSRDLYGYSVNDMRYTDFLTPNDINYVKCSLEQCGHEVVLIGDIEGLMEFHNGGGQVDLVFNMAWGLHGRNREGNVPAMLEVLGIPYTGTDAFGCSLCLSKIQTKLVAQHLWVPTPEFFIIQPGELERFMEDIPLPFPLVLKPSEEGSSMGVTLVEDMAAFRATASELLHLYPGPVVCERYIKGRELAVPLLETENGVIALGIIETTTLEGTPLPLFDAHLKTTKLYKKQLAVLPEELEYKMKQYSLDIFRFIHGAGLGRADFRLAEDGTPYFLEMAPLPSLGAKSSYNSCVEKTGGSFPLVLQQIIARACEKYGLAGQIAQ